MEMIRASKNQSIPHLASLVLLLFLLYSSFPCSRQCHSCYSLVLVQANLVNNLNTDKLSLVAIKSRIVAATVSSHKNTITSNWSEEIPVCEWSGVTCRRKRVVALNISHMGVGATIPPEIGNLSFLVSLDMAGNSFYGEFPHNLLRLHRLKLADFSNNSFSGDLPNSLLGNMTSLQELRFNHNNFSGTIPEEISDLNDLKVLDLGYNNLEGCIPPRVFNLSTLEAISLKNNRVSGSLPIDMCLNGLHSLTVLDIIDNRIGGQIPSTLSHCSHLQYLLISANDFTGQLPNQIGNITGLQLLAADNNSLSGTVPPEISHLRNLKSLYLGDNHLEGDVLPIFNISTLENISLKNNRLWGSLPVDMCGGVNGGLESLIILDIVGNMIGGEIPSTFSRCSGLRYALLSSNNFTGKLPEDIGNISGLEMLAAQSNRLSGSIPPTIGKFSNLINLVLKSNNLTGPIPPSIYNLSSLIIVDLSGNSLEGSIPQCIGNLSKLKIMDLSENHLHGSIPDTFQKGNNFAYLNLNGNQLEGTLPKSLVNCRKLLVLDVGSNRIQDAFPSWMETLSKLVVLVIKSNRFHGQVMSITKTPFQKLRIFDISRNEFNGSIPDEYIKNFVAMINGKINSTEESELFFAGPVAQVIKGVERAVPKILIGLITIIDLSDNEFEGSISPSIGNLVSLKQLNLSGNRLIGQIPKTFGNLRALESLDLSSNQLGGEIPRELVGLISLSMLNLSWNDFTGPIPLANQFLTFDSTSYLGNPGLCGYPYVPNKCRRQDDGLSMSPISPAGKGDGHGFFNGFTRSAVLIGYGFGLLVGVELGYLMFLWGRPLWFLGLYGKLESCIETLASCFT